MKTTRFQNFKTFFQDGEREGHAKHAGIKSFHLARTFFSAKV
jgi:hypothetical protein